MYRKLHGIDDSEVDDSRMTQDEFQDLKSRYPDKVIVTDGGNC